MFSRRSREERETGGASERCLDFGRLSFIDDEAKARLRRFVENPNKKKTKRNARAAMCIEIPR